jgi:DNA-binding FadR family transcriptional regulator
MTLAEMRPLSIMTIKDRVMATIISFAVEARWEAVLEPNVMGYRARRCTQDAIQVIFKALSKGNPAILDADIKSFFDTIKSFFDTIIPSCQVPPISATSTSMAEEQFRNLFTT